MEKLGLPIIGDKLPNLEVVTTFGKMELPKDLSGKWFILFSHPADFTPVCTTEFVAFAALHDKFKEINTELIGLSVDAVTAHIKWTEWIYENLNQEITFPIIADSLGEVSYQLGMIHKAKGSDTVRAVFVVDNKGILRTMMYYPQEAGRNVEEILRITKALQYADKHQVAMPENWPNNKFSKDDVIIPPAKTQQLAEKRKKELQFSEDVNYHDWWFITKKIDQ